MKLLHNLLLLVVGAFFLGCSASFAAENKYTFRNNSFLEIKVSLWFTSTIKGIRKETPTDYTAQLPGILPQGLPLPDVERILQPREEEVASFHDGQIQPDDCLAYVVAEYRVIPTLHGAMQAAGISTDLFLVGKRFWAQKLPGLCGENILEMNYDPATYLKFTIKINGVEDYFQDVMQTS